MRASWRVGMAGTVARGAPPIAPPTGRGGPSEQLAISQLGGSVRPMDIDEFYEADPRRRASAELELGTEWLDADGVRHELNYVEDTGELYVLREPAPHVTRGPLRRACYVKAPPGYERKMTVHVIASIPTKDELHTDPRRVAGRTWRPQDGPQWLGDRLRAAGVAVGPPGDIIVDDGPDPRA